MPSEFTVDTGDKVTPENKGGPRVGVGAVATVSRDSDGAIGLQILRGDGGDPEAFTYTVRTKWYGPFTPGQQVELTIGCMDLPMPDFTPRSYRFRVVADQGAELTVYDAFVAPSPFAPAGVFPSP